MSIRLATFNVENLDDAASADPPLDQRIGVLRPQLQRLDADILCLQEINARRADGGGDRILSALDGLLADTPYAAFNRAVSLSDSGRRADVHNLATLSRWPIAAREDIARLTQPSHILRSGDRRGEQITVDYERRGLLTGIDVGRRCLWVVNLHLKSPAAAHIAGAKVDPFTWSTAAAWAEGCYLAALKRNGQALDARRRIDGIFDDDADALVAVCGDLNAELDEVPVRLLQAAETDTGNGALAYRCLIAPERGLAATQRHTVIHHGRPEMLDHILVSRNLMGHYRSLEVHNEGLADELVGFAAVQRDPASYHAPMVATFSLAPE